eukprot:11426646-Alexandrium_andersonii.AAC.1
MVVPIVAGNMLGCALKSPLDPVGAGMVSDDVMVHGMQGMHKRTVSAEPRNTSITIVEDASAPPPPRTTGDSISLTVALVVWPGDGPTGNLSSTCVPWNPLHIETVLAPALQDVGEDSPQVA